MTHGLRVPDVLLDSLDTSVLTSFKVIALSLILFGFNFFF
jgi:hypothetical protein